MPRDLSRLAALPALALLAGCELGQSCTLMYAPSFVQVELLADEWPEGLWEIEALGASCTGELPDTQSWECPEGALTVELSDDGTALLAFQLQDQAPDSFEVTIRHDGVEVVTATIVPDYVEDEPNGEGCGVRRSGTAELDLDA